MRVAAPDGAPLSEAILAAVDRTLGRHAQDHREVLERLDEIMATIGTAGATPQACADMPAAELIVRLSKMLPADLDAVVVTLPAA